MYYIVYCVLTAVRSSATSLTSGPTTKINISSD